MSIKKVLYTKVSLGKYLLHKGESAHQFALRSRISHSTIYKVLKGVRISKRIARKIERHSKGEVKVENVE